MTRGGPSEIVREMGYTIGEFARVLPAAMRDWTVSGGTGDWRVSRAGGEPVARIRTEVRPDRRIGALSLPVLTVSITFADSTQDLVAEFMLRFDRGFHRGGG